MIYRIELADRTFNRLEYLESEALGLSWEYARDDGGCGAFSFDLPRSLCNEKSISGDFNVKIKRRNPLTGVYDLRYQGLIERKEPIIKGHEETVRIEGHGYWVQLGRVRLTQTYVGMEISDIVKDILDNYVLPETQITYDSGDIEPTGFTPDQLEFKNVTAKEALQTCAETAGGIEHGVDRNIKYFFKARSEDVNFQFPSNGGQLVDFSYEEDFASIVNHVFVQGGDVAGVPYTYDAGNQSSKSKYGYRSEVIQNSAIVTDAVAQQFIDAVLTEKAFISPFLRSGRGKLVNYEDMIEEVTPIGLFYPIVRGDLFGEKLFGEGLFSGPLTYQINRISYSIADQGGDMNVSLTLGHIRPDEAEYLSRLQNRIEAIRTANL